MSNNTSQPKAGEKHAESSCCAKETAGEAHKPAQLQDRTKDRKTAGKPPCGCN